AHIHVKHNRTERNTRIIPFDPELFNKFPKGHPLMFVGIKKSTFAKLYVLAECQVVIDSASEGKQVYAVTYQIKVISSSLSGRRKPHNNFIRPGFFMKENLKST